VFRVLRIRLWCRIMCRIRLLIIMIRSRSLRRRLPFLRRRPSSIVISIMRWIRVLSCSSS